MKKLIKTLFKAAIYLIVVLLLFIGSLFFWSVPIPGHLVNMLGERFLPESLVVTVDKATIGISDGVGVLGLTISEVTDEGVTNFVAGAESVTFYPIGRRLEAVDLHYPRLPQGYYEEKYAERNEPIRIRLPEIGRFALSLDTPDILGVRPEHVDADVEIRGNRLTVDRIHLTWPDRDEPMSVSGQCIVDFRSQVVQGEVTGFAKQYHIRPLLVALDLPVSLPYMDGFTEVKGKVPAKCAWNVNLINSDFRLDLDLAPTMGRYNGVEMKRAKGPLAVETSIRGTNLNYRVTIGPIHATGIKDEDYVAETMIIGTEGMNQVVCTGKSTLPVADLLKIGGFEDEYVGRDVVGKSEVQLEFNFPRDMGADITKLNGKGHVEIKDGQIFRLKGFSGLLELLSTRIPGGTSITDSTQATCDYTIENGVIHSDNIYIEGDVVSILMYGDYHLSEDRLDFTVRVQFTRKDSMLGQILHPLTSPVTKLLLEFKLKGSAKDPQWEYISVIDRVWEGITE